MKKSVMKGLNVGFGFLALSILAGCASSSVQPLTAKKYPNKPADCGLEFYTDANRVQRKYSELALVTHKTEQDAFSDKGAAKITEALRKEACKLGADGLIIKSAIQGTWGDPGRGEGIAIKFE
ncbi:MAG: hypothetical protein C5B49_00090 [Bdellovibrio sp.]|nr:MAG: hypothetical protein C5B49_00090 [Bdellovibrio sp.]